ncbi:MAG: nickel-dependent lactate racemase [Acidobacteria bacterium]|nr:MAG: nickel-dependent lactate racemase [Acidobacteriota bacterium]
MLRSARVSISRSIRRGLKSWSVPTRPFCSSCPMQRGRPRRLIADGVEPHRMAIIFATGIHRKVTEEEKRAILTPFIAQRIKTFDHDARDLMRISRVGETSGGIPVELNRALFEYGRVVLIGGVTFHYFAGFTGGRKLVCPGLASSKTISATHKLAFDCERMDRREGVSTGLLHGNAVHEAFVEAASKAKIDFAISAIVNDAGDVTDVFCGDQITSHRAACDTFASQHKISIAEKRELVIASCGGYPFDINMIQAHKSLEAASKACIDGGTIVLLAECRDGLGRDDFLNWFDAEDSGDLGRRLCEKYQVNGQTAWSFLKKAERFKVAMVSSLDEDILGRMRSKKLRADGVEALINEKTRGYLIPNASKLQIITGSN